MMSNKVCPRCEGTGKFGYSKCGLCDGAGKLWCAMCGTMGDHRSGTCPELNETQSQQQEIQNIIEPYRVRMEEIKDEWNAEHISMQARIDLLKAELAEIKSLASTALEWGLNGSRGYSATKATETADKLRKLF